METAPLKEEENSTNPGSSSSSSSGTGEKRPIIVNIMTECDLFDYFIQVLKEAVQLDESRSYAKALVRYQHSIMISKSLYKLFKCDRSRHALLDKIAEVQERVLTIENYLEKKAAKACCATRDVNQDQGQMLSKSY